MKQSFLNVERIIANREWGAKNSSPNSIPIPLDSIVNLNHPSSLRDLEEDDD